METIIYVMAGNDVNGNPRRGWIIPGAGPDRSDAFVDEGYAGRDALYTYLHLPMKDKSLNIARLNYDTHVTEVVLDITVSQYNKLKRGK
jgi:hypothetical protein